MMKIVVAEDSLLALVVTDTQTLVVSAFEIKDDGEGYRGCYSVGIQDVRMCLVKDKEKAQEAVRTIANYLGDGSMLRMTGW